MANNNSAQRIYRHETRNLPLPRQRGRTRDHNSSTCKTENESPFEALEKAREFFKERGVFHFFCGGAPRHVGFEEMAEEGLGYVERDSAEEDSEEEEPFEVLEYLGVLVVCEYGK
jgi:hypothetical protein